MGLEGKKGNLKRFPKRGTINKGVPMSRDNGRSKDQVVAGRKQREASAGKKMTGLRRERVGEKDQHSCQCKGMTIVYKEYHDLI